MFIAFALALSALWTTAVVDVIVESTSSGATRLSLFGHTVFRPASTGSAIVILTALAASAAFALSLASARWGRRRIAQRVTAEVDQRWRAASEADASAAAKTDLMQWRIQELQNSLDTLTAKRDEVLADIAASKRPAKAATPSLVAVPDIEPDGTPAETGPGPMERHPSRDVGTTV